MTISDDDAFENHRHKPENLDAEGYPRPALTPFAPFDILEHVKQSMLSADKLGRLLHGVVESKEKL